MNVRRVLPVLTALAVLGPVPAVFAAPSARAKTVCNLIKDAEGDGGLRATTYGPVNLNSPPMDVIVGDIATGARTVVATIKVNSLEMDPQAFPSATYEFFFRAKTTEYVFTAKRNWQGETDYSFSGGSVKGSVITATKTIRFETARSNVKPLSARGTKLTELRVKTKNGGNNADSTALDPKFAYADRTPSCLKPA